MESTYIKNCRFGLNEKQNKFIDLVLDGYHVALTGGAGVGKSYVLNQLFKILDHKNVLYGKTSSTGISAINIGGSTLHSFCGVGLGDTSKESLLRDVFKRKKAKNRIKNCQMLVIDEASMIKSSLFDKIDYIFRKVRGIDTPFGGVQMVITFDVLQLPPVIRSEEKDGFFFESEVYQNLEIKNIILTEIIRQKDKEFAELLSNLRVGKTDGIELLDQCVGREFPDDINPVKLYTKNKWVDLENQRRLDEIKSPIVTFRCIDNGQPHHIKFFDKNCPAPKVLQLKEGAQVMLLKNLDTKGGLVNGSIGKVIKIGIAGVTVKFECGTEIIQRDTWDIKEEDFVRGKRKVKTIASRSQIPLKLAWGATVHKSQGATLDHAHIDISDAFESGQAYVALSRVRDINNLRLEPFCPSKIMVNKKCLEFYKNLRED